MTNTDLLSTVQAAEVLGVQRSTLTRWVQSGRLHEALKLPGDTGSRLFHRDEVLRLKAERDAEAEAEAQGAA